MKFQISSLFVFLVLTVLMMVVPNQISAANPITDCWNQWSRCSKWSSGGNGVLWQECSEHCVCLGYTQGGKCVEVPSQCFLTPKALQCQCQGPKGPTGENCGP